MGRLSLQFRLVGVRETQGGSTPHTAAKAETTAVREHFVVPSIHSPEVARAQRSRVRRGEDAL